MQADDIRRMIYAAVVADRVRTGRPSSDENGVIDPVAFERDHWKIVALGDEAIIAQAVHALDPGAVPLGVSFARWWDQKIVEARAALAKADLSARSALRQHEADFLRRASDFLFDSPSYTDTASAERMRELADEIDTMGEPTPKPNPFGPKSKAPNPVQTDEWGMR